MSSETNLNSMPKQVDIRPPSCVVVRMKKLVAKDMKAKNLDVVVEATNSEEWRVSAAKQEVLVSKY